MRPGQRPFFWHGDVVGEGHVYFESHVMITGSVRAHGVVSDAGNDSCVTIGGDLSCRALYTSGDFAVSGVIAARDVVLGYNNDFVLTADLIVFRSGA